jgi:hypothetical protein
VESSTLDVLKALEWARFELGEEGLAAAELDHFGFLGLFIAFFFLKLAIRWDESREQPQDLSGVGSDFKGNGLKRSVRLRSDTTLQA